MAIIKQIKLPNEEIYDIFDPGAVRYDRVQNLTEDEKSQARENIGVEYPDISPTTEAGGDLEVLTGIEAELNETTNIYEITATSRTLSGDNTHIEATASTNNNLLLISHLGTAPTQNSNTSASPTHGESFEVLDSVECDDKGHLTSFTKKTVTLPSLDNIEINYSHPYGTSLPTSGNVGDVFLLLES